MPPMGGPMSRGFLTEEEKANRPKVTLPLLKRIFLHPIIREILLPA